MHGLMTPASSNGKRIPRSCDFDSQKQPRKRDSNYVQNLRATARN